MAPLARSGSQSHRAIWFILPARGARHIISLFTNTYIKFSFFLPAEKGRRANDWYRHWLHWDKRLQFGACRQTLPHWSKTLSLWNTLYTQTLIFNRANWSENLRKLNCNPKTNTKNMVSGLTFSKIRKLGHLTLLSCTGRLLNELGHLTLLFCTGRLRNEEIFKTHVCLVTFLLSLPSWFA